MCWYIYTCVDIYIRVHIFTGGCTWPFLVCHVHYPPPHMTHMYPPPHMTHRGVYLALSCRAVGRWCQFSGTPRPPTPRATVGAIRAKRRHHCNKVSEVLYQNLLIVSGCPCHHSAPLQVCVFLLRIIPLPILKKKKNVGDYPHLICFFFWVGCSGFGRSLLAPGSYSFTYP